jgi:hypothetical protein
VKVTFEIEWTDQMNNSYPPESAEYRPRRAGAAGLTPVSRHSDSNKAMRWKDGVRSDEALDPVARNPILPDTEHVEPDHEANRKIDEKR